jgi:hypothetical protein
MKKKFGVAEKGCHWSTSVGPRPSQEGKAERSAVTTIHRNSNPSNGL